MGDDPTKISRVIDLSYGGLALEVNAADEMEPTFDAVLHVPILPPVRVSLRKLYTISTPNGHARIGCAFVT